VPNEHSRMFSIVRQCTAVYEEVGNAEMYILNENVTNELC